MAAAKNSSHSAEPLRAPTAPTSHEKPPPPVASTSTPGSGGTTVSASQTETAPQVTSQWKLGGHEVVRHGSTVHWPLVGLQASPGAQLRPVQFDGSQVRAVHTPSMQTWFAAHAGVQVNETHSPSRQKPPGQFTPWHGST